MIRAKAKEKSITIYVVAAQSAILSPFIRRIVDR